MLIKHGDGTAFQRVPEGVNVYELTGKFEAMKPDESRPEDKDKLKDVKYLEWCMTDDPNMTFTQRVDMSNEKSLRPFMDSLFYSGYCTKMHNKNPQKYDDPEKGWEDGILRHEMFAKDLMIHGKGCRAKLSIVHNKALGKDGKERVYANIINWEFVDKSAINTSAKKPTTTNPPVSTNEREW